MSWLRRLVNLTRRDEIARDIDREMAFHIAERVDELREGGMTEREARFAARRQFGNAGLQRERARDADLLPGLEAIGQDARYAMRTMRAHPAFSAVVVLSLAMGIGANAAIFSIIDALILRKLPVHQPEELAQVVGSENRVVFSNPVWEQLRDGPTPFAGAFVTGGASFELPGGGELRRVRGNWVSGSFFPTLGLTPAHGRLLTVNDDVRGCGPIVVLGYPYFQSEFGGDPGVVGKRVTLGEHSYEIVGVAPKHFRGIDVGTAAQVYVPLCRSGGLRNSNFNFLRIVGRLAPGTSVDAASAKLSARSPAIFAATVAPQSSGQQRESYLGTRLGARGIPTGLSWVRDQFAKPLLILMGVAVLVLIVTCANIANLLLARAAARQRELSIRLAIGASRGRLLRQLLTESVLLSLLGAAAGVVAAIWGSKALVALMSTSLSGVTLDVTPDARLLGFAVAMAFATGIVFGMAPAWRVLGVDLALPLGRAAARAIRVRSHHNVPRALVVVQFAVSTILIIGATLFLQTFRALVNADPGFDARNILIVSIDLSTVTKSGDPGPLVRETERQLESLAGVEAVSTINMTPLSGSSNTYMIRPEGSLLQEGIRSYVNKVGPGYFATMRARLVAGRPFTTTDVAGAPPVAIVTEQGASRLFGTRSALGKRFRMSGEPDAPTFEVVGVARDAKFLSLREEPLPMVLISNAQEKAHPHPQFMVRYGGTEGEIRNRVTGLLQRLAPSATVTYDTMQNLVDGSLVTERVLTYLSGFFGSIGLIVAVIGLYGLMSYVVTTRQQEIGIRMALGAKRGQILRGVLTEASVLTTGGAIAGIVIAVASARFVSALLYGVSVADIRSVGSAVALLLIVATMASLIPAWRASRLDPLVALREQ